MEPQKVAFVICINDETLYSRCRNYLDQLIIPPGFKVEVKEIRGAKGMASAYNLAMRESDAKYKVYLHQDTFIFNRNLILDMVEVFTKYPKIGMIGVVGGNRLPKSGIWFHDGLHSFGKVWEYRGPGSRLPLPHWNERRERIVRFRPVARPFQPVLVIDGLIMMTQYDIPWREELYDSFLYYEGPQSLEYIKHGYWVAIPYQKEPCCMHWGPQQERTEEGTRQMWTGIRANAEIFCKEYHDFIGVGVKRVLNRYASAGTEPKARE